MQNSILLFILVLLSSLSLSAQVVNIPDVNFKTYLLENDLINTNGDGEIQLTEAEAFTGQIQCAGRQISSLEGIEAFTSLDRLSCFSNPINTLDVSKNIELTWLQCYFNGLEQLDVSKNFKLEHLNCHSNSLETLDVTNNPELTVLGFQNNALTDLDISQQTKLTKLTGYSNQITSLSINHMTELRQLSFAGNPLGSVDLSDNPELNWIDLNFCDLTELDLSNNPLLARLSCRRNDLNQLDLSNHPMLVYLDCADNKLSQLDISENNLVFYLDCSTNNLTQIDLSAQSALSQFYCQENSIQSIDLSDNPLLEEVGLADNNLTSCNVANGNNADITYFTANGNEELECIQVDDVIFSTNQADWMKDDAAMYSLNCEGLSSNNPTAFVNLNIFPNPATELILIEKTDHEIDQVRLFNSNGEELQITGANNNSLNIVELSSGSYFVQVIYTDQKIGTAHFIKAN